MAEAPHKVIVIDPMLRSIYSREMTGWKDMVQLCPGGICIAGHENNGDVLFVDDEGLLNPLPDGSGFRWKSRPDGQPLLSRGILCGPDAPDGSDRTGDVQTTVAEVAALVEWLDLDQVNDWFRAHADVPATVITTIEDDGSIDVTPFGSLADFVQPKKGK